MAPPMSAPPPITSPIPTPNCASAPARGALTAPRAPAVAVVRRVVVVRRGAAAAELDDREVPTVVDRVVATGDVRPTVVLLELIAVVVVLVTVVPPDDVVPADELVPADEVVPRDDVPPDDVVVPSATSLTLGCDALDVATDSVAAMGRAVLMPISVSPTATTAPPLIRATSSLLPLMATRASSERAVPKSFLRRPPTSVLLS